MKKEPKVTVNCRWCSAELPENHSGPCPRCGKEGRHIKIEVSEVIGVIDETVSVVKEIKYKKTEWLFNLLASLLTMLGVGISLYLLRITALGKFIPIIIVLTVGVAIASGIKLYNLRKKNQIVRIEKLEESEKDLFQSIDDSINNLLEGR